MKTHYTIPVFIPELACPHRCVFCNQQHITSVMKSPSIKEVKGIINRYLSTIPENRFIDIGFLGGNFTGIPAADQEAYLETALPFIENGLVEGVRVSTRPDYISDEILRRLKKYHVKTIELGAQSMDDEVLEMAARGHTSSDTKKAAKMIRDYGFNLGLQMMTGLPGDTLQKSLMTAREIAGLGASSTRIYPTLVIKGTYLETLWREKKYQPQTLKQTIEWLIPIMDIFEQYNINVLRVGLHPTEGFLNGRELLDGPFHPSLRQLVISERWKMLLTKGISSQPAKNLILKVNPKDMAYASGYMGQNKKLLQQWFKSVKLKQDNSVKKGTFYADYC